jgi:asparagine synthase (glutamine-hydrolysing)
MSGICGVIGTDPATIRRSVAAMARALRHRGPDDHGDMLVPLGTADHGGFAGLGFRRLSIRDRSPAARQPMVCPDTGDCLIFNGEIHNFRALRAELQAAGIQVRSSGDTEVLLRALSTWREIALTKIEGMFSLAYYHARSRRILLARDPLGIKPLYVAATDKGFVFASEIRALRASGLVADDLDAAGIAGLLAYGSVPSPRTVFRAIRSFPAAAYQWITADVVTGRPPADASRFWNFAAQPQAVQDSADAVAHVRRLLDDSVRRHLQADVPVGICLSGGIDSAVLAALARTHSSRLTAFTIGFEGRHGEDEFTGASATAAALDMRHVSLAIGTRRLSSQWRDWLASVDSPSIDGFNTHVVSELMAVAGTVVGLSGIGADELFGGYSSFPRALRLASWARALHFVSPGWRATALPALGRMTGRLGAFEKLADAISGDASVAGIALAAHRVIGNASLRAMGLGSETLGLRGDYLDPPLWQLETAFDGDEFNTVSRIEMTHFMADTLLRDADAHSMRHARELRLPFLDLPLVDYVASLPGSQKQRNAGPAKPLLRDVARSLVGDAVLRRPQAGFTLPIGAWMRTELRDLCTAAIETTAQLPFLEAAAVRRVWKTFLRDGRGRHWSQPMALVALGSYLMQPSPGELHAASTALHRQPLPRDNSHSTASSGSL